MYLEDEGRDGMCVTPAREESKGGSQSAVIWPDGGVEIVKY